MSRTAKPGIGYYPMDSDHVTNYKIKLLVNEFDSHGYWIYQCILCEIANDKGYFMDVSDSDQLILFASDVCKKQVSLVKEVIAGCIRRGLFDRSVFDAFKVLTNDRVQDNYFVAKKELMKKGTVIKIIKEFWVTEFFKYGNKFQYLSLKNYSSREESDNSQEESYSSREQVPQRRVEESRGDKSREDERGDSTFVPPTPTEVFDFFKEKIGDFWNVKKCKTEADKFVNRYASVNWKVGKAKIQMVDWKSSAENWITTDQEWEVENGKSSTHKNVAAPAVVKSQASEPSKEPSPEQRIELSKNVVIRSYQEFIKKGYYEDYANTVYNSLANILKSTHFLEFIDGKDGYFNDKGAAKFRNRPAQETDMKNGILRTMEDNKLKSAEDNERHVVEGKKEAVKEFFQQVQEMEILIESIF